ncbi:hypothetical protein Xen7305DRAFT_00014140 [Xenococcus sp. PCC 7305]|uniref:hypothetical protein n=1 Tax=Xenococcus sp. PCC 7305 TaxID=102125 RepID=UPI0002ACD76F|nr:hypothetical protein [Xenococcus sp. PCC 7305]ELS01709.1 hypothetical protein Xen7305DRAFT_00014140 [Xenococcus sp. PCC 7305]
MSKVDFWFLNLAVRTPISFLTVFPYDQCIVPDPYLTPFKLSTNQIVDSLFNLFQDGFLSTITPADLDSLDTKLVDEILTKAFIPSRKQIKAALDRENLDNNYDDKELYYFLTEEGAKKWKSVAKPKWNQFFRRCILDWESVSENLLNNSIPPYGSIFCCANKKFGEKIISIEHLLDDPEFISYPIKNSIIWEKFTPWHPVYWKTLPCGYAVSYQVELVEIDKNIEQSNESSDLIEQKKQAREWYQKISNWYEN